MDSPKRVLLATDASGGVAAAREGFGVVIVDVIDMSTTLESAMDSGAWMVFGASPDFTRAPVVVDPERIGRLAARAAMEAGVGVVVVGEPRTGDTVERFRRCQKLMTGLNSQGIYVDEIIPNLGAETHKLTTFEKQVVIAVTDTGGVAFDAAFQVTQHVVTGTVARSRNKKGIAPTMAAVDRAMKLLEILPGVAVVAASSNSQEDLLAAKFIVEKIQERLGRRV